LASIVNNGDEFVPFTELLERSHPHAETHVEYEDQIEEFLEGTDFLSVHLPATPETKPTDRRRARYALQPYAAA
jgi:hypothetical protein